MQYIRLVRLSSLKCIHIRLCLLITGLCIGLVYDVFVVLCIYSLGTYSYMKTTVGDLTCNYD